MSDVEIPLRDRAGTTLAVAVVDAEDAPLLLEGLPWRLMSNGYAFRMVRVDGRRRPAYLHRHVLGLGTGDWRQVDHVNGDRLDCRRSNLRIVTQAQNAQNAKSQGGYSRHRGVTWDKRKNRWYAGVQLNGRRIYLGCFATEQEAAVAAAEGRARHLTHAVEGRHPVAS